MKKVKGIKNLVKTIQLLRKLSRNKEYELISPDFERDQKVNLKKTNKGFLFSIEHDDLIFKHGRFDF